MFLTVDVLGQKVYVVVVDVIKVDVVEIVQMGWPGISQIKKIKNNSTLILFVSTSFLMFVNR